jgi:hypothetical protein
MCTRRASTLVVIGAIVSLALAGACSKNAAPPPPILKSAPVSPPVPAAAPAPTPPSLQAAMFVASDLPLLPPGVVNAVRPVAVTKAVY